MTIFYRYCSFAQQTTFAVRKLSKLGVERVSRGGQRCYCQELRFSRSFTVRGLVLNPGPRELAVVESAVKLLRIKRSITSVRADICACKGSRLAFILSSINYGEILTLFSSLPPIIPVSASPVFSSPCVDISGCVLNLY